MSGLNLKRRTILRGLGAGLALPLLEAMAPVCAETSAAATAPTRMAFIFFPNGAIMPQWKVSGDDTSLTLSPTLKPLESHRDDLTIFTGLTQHHARANGDGGGDHARNASAFLTGCQPRKTSGANIGVGISADQAAAAKIGNLTRLPSLELGIERGRNAGSCDSGYSCAYSSNISWKTESTPMAKEINPRLVFERMFGSRESLDTMRRRNHDRKSILDVVADDAARLQSRLGQTDRRKIDEYFNSVREIEQRIDRSATRIQDVPELDIPHDLPRELDQHIRLMYDLMVLAFQTDTTRIITFMLGNAGCNRTYPMIDVKDGHHELSHHRDDKNKVERIARIDHYLTKHFSYFLDRLKSTPEGSSNLLHNSMILYGSAISDGNRHAHHDLPIVLAGRAGGAIRTGRLVAHPNETPLNNLFLTMCNHVGAGIDKLGNSTEPLVLS